jgi:putative zinc finger/helix-turn-helix YgiT family protein
MKEQYSHSMKRENMTSQMACPRCEMNRDAEAFEREETVTISGRDVAFKAQLSRCTVCSEEFEAPGQLDANLAAAREAWSRLYESPVPAALVELRNKYGASQKAFGLVLGLGALTMNTYEQGSAPDSANRLLLKLAENPVFFSAMYVVNSQRIGAIQRRRIESSPGYRLAGSWTGLEALAASLTAVQRAKVEACAESGQQSVLQQVVTYVSAGSFEEYSNLIRGATWSASSSGLLDQQGTLPADLMKAAS